MKRLTYLLVLIILTGGCLNGHQQKGFWGDDRYSVTKIQDNIFKVTVREDDSTRTGRSSDFALLKCAEVTLENGYKYFVFLDERSLVIQCYREKPEENIKTVYDAEQISRNMTPQDDTNQESKNMTNQ